MVMGSSVTAFADEGSQTGTGDIEGIVNTDVFSVVLPTATEETYKFILDPQGLIAATDSAAYSGATFTGSNLYFNSAENVYGDTSAVLTAINKSSFDVDIDLKATLTDYDGLAVKSSADDATGETTDPAIYLAIKKEAGTVAYNYEGTPSIEMTNAAAASAITEEDGVASVSATQELAAPATDDNNKAAYVYNYADGEYSYVLNNAWEGNFNGVAFALTGAINTYDPTSASTVDGWADLANITPSVNVVWSIENPNEEEVTPTEMSAATLSGTTLACRLVSGENATAANVSSVKIGNSVVSSTSSASEMYYEVVSSGAIKIYNVSVNTGTVTIVYNGTTYQKTF